MGARRGRCHGKKTEVELGPHIESRGQAVNLPSIFGYLAQTCQGDPLSMVHSRCSVFEPHYSHVSKTEASLQVYVAFQHTADAL